MSKPKPPQVVVTIVEGKDLIPEPQTFWTKHRKFTAYCKVEFQGSSKKTKELTIDAESKSYLPFIWNESFSFPVDLKKLSERNIVHIDVFYKDISLGKIEVKIEALIDDQSFESWTRISGNNNGMIRIAIVRSGLSSHYASNVPVVIQPYPTSQYPQTNQLSPSSPQYQPLNQYYQPPPTSPQQTTAQYQQASYHQTQNQNPSSPYQSPPVSQYNPQYNNASVYPSSPAPSAPRTQTLQVPIAESNYSPLHSPSQIHPNVPPPLPLKTQLPEETARRTVISNHHRATQTVSEKALTDYFRFCGSFSSFYFEDPIAVVCFERDYEADTALFLDNGNVGGSPIEVFRYDDAYCRLKDNRHRAQTERLLTKLLNTPQSKGPQASTPIPQSAEQQQMERESQAAVDSLESTHISPKIFVRNISPKAEASIVEDFFSYCGKVDQVDLYKEAMIYGTAVDATQNIQCAAVTFEHRDSATTALLLSSAYIYERPISVFPLSSDTERSLNQQKPCSSASNHLNKAPTTGKHSQSSTVASIMAGGYTVDGSVVQKAKYYDQKKGVAATVGKTLQNAKEKLTDFDNKYEITNQAKKGGEALLSFGKSLFTTKPSPNSSPKVHPNSDNQKVTK